MPTALSHHRVPVNGITLHYAEQGSGPPVVLCHGFPELWFSWRHQIPALAMAGFRAIALDQRGYGESDAPPEIEDYGLQNLLGDLLALLDALALPRAIFIGHDWGSVVVWNLALRYPERVSAVASLNLPFRPRSPINPLERMPEYQRYFQTPGVAEAELDAEVERFFRLTMRGSDPEEKSGELSPIFRIGKRGGLLAGLPEDPPPSAILTAEDLNYYVRSFKRTGFRGGLNWYRNIERNWKWNAEMDDRKIEQPALMVTAGKDSVLTPALAEGMEEWVPNLTRAHIENCGHWTQQEHPQQVNRFLIDWLKNLPASAIG